MPTKRQRSIAEEETHFRSAIPLKVFTIKVIDPDKDNESSLVFQRASTASKAVELVKKEHPEWKCLVIDSHEPKPWRRDERY